MPRRQVTECNWTESRGQRYVLNIPGLLRIWRPNSRRDFRDEPGNSSNARRRSPLRNGYNDPYVQRREDSHRTHRGDNGPTYRPYSPPVRPSAFDSWERLCNTMPFIEESRYPREPPAHWHVEPIYEVREPTWARQEYEWAPHPQEGCSFRDANVGHGYEERQLWPEYCYDYGDERHDCQRQGPDRFSRPGSATSSAPRMQYSFPSTYTDPDIPHQHPSAFSPYRYQEHAPYTHPHPHPHTRPTGYERYRDEVEEGRYRPCNHQDNDNHDYDSVPPPASDPPMDDGRCWQSHIGGRACECDEGCDINRGWEHGFRDRPSDDGDPNDHPSSGEH